MIGLSEIVLDVVIFRRITQFDKFVFECSGLFEKTMYLAFNFHNIARNQMSCTKTTPPERFVHILLLFYICSNRNAGFLIV